jgi:hypothetical protein
MRFWEHVEKTPYCWLWTGSLDRHGYGKVGAHGEGLAHRLSYVLNVGPIPEGLTLDHLCRNPRCVNPAHLEPVTGRENKLRGIGFAAQNAAKEACPLGHPLSGENLYEHGGRRGCRACRRFASQKRSAA